MTPADNGRRLVAEKVRELAALLEKVAEQRRRIEELRGGEEPLEPLVEHAIAELVNSAPGKTGPKSKIMRDIGVHVIVQSCLKELPPIRGSSNRAYKMAHELLARHGHSMSDGAIRAACKNAKKALQKTYLPLR